MIRVIIAGQLSSDRRKRLRLGKGFGQSLRCLYPFGARNFKIFIVIRGISTESFILSLHPASFLFAQSSLISFSVNKNFLMNFLKDPLRRNEGWSLTLFLRESRKEWRLKRILLFMIFAVRGLPRGLGVDYAACVLSSSEILHDFFLIKY